MIFAIKSEDKEPSIPSIWPAPAPIKSRQQNYFLLGARLPSRPPCCRVFTCAGAREKRKPLMSYSCFGLSSTESIESASRFTVPLFSDGKERTSQRRKWKESSSRWWVSRMLPYTVSKSVKMKDEPGWRESFSIRMSTKRFSHFFPSK